MSCKIQSYRPLVYIFCIVIISGWRSNDAVAKHSKQRRGILKWNEESTSSVFQFIEFYFYLKNVTLHISHVFYGNYTRISAPPWHESPGVLCHFLLSALGGITRQGYRVISGQIFWYVTLEASWYIYIMSTCHQNIITTGS